MSIHFDKPKSSPSTRVGLMCTDGACPILNELQTYGILQRCVLLNNEKSDDASSIMQAVEKVASGKLDYAVAIVKKHGDDLENEATGFGLGKYANIATRFIRGEKLDYGIHKFLIINCNDHPEKGVETSSWKDPRVLNFYVRRNKSSCENVGDEFSGNLRKKTDAYCIEVSLEDGCFGDPDSSAIVDHILIPVAMDFKPDLRKKTDAYCIEVSLEDGCFGDPDSSAIVDHILIPVAMDFKPDMIIILVGLDEDGCDLMEGYQVTRFGYSNMLKKLMDSTHAKVMIAFEQGYDVNSLLESVPACLYTLLDNKFVVSSQTQPSESTWSKVKMVCEEWSQYWPTLVDELPKIAQILRTNCVLPSLEKLPIHGICDVEENESLQSTLSAGNQERCVWCAAYGPSMDMARFLCYIEGKKVPGTRMPLLGCRDKTSPGRDLWKVVPYRLFFGAKKATTDGGLPFLNLRRNNRHQTHVRIYKITFDQFNDVLLQENEPNLFDVDELNSVEKKQYLPLRPLKGWYKTVLFLGKHEGLPILTVTCSPSALMKFKLKQYHLTAPSGDDKYIMANALEKECKLPKEVAINYIKKAYEQPLSS